jgi:hypothetical protein
VSLKVKNPAVEENPWEPVSFGFIAVNQAPPVSLQVRWRNPDAPEQEPLVEIMSFRSSSEEGAS